MRKSSARKWMLELAMVLVTIVFVIPVWMVLVNSFKNEKEAAFFGIGLPGSLQFENYVKVFE